MAGKKKIAKASKKVRRSQAGEARSNLSSLTGLGSPRLIRTLTFAAIAAVLVYGVSVGMARLENRVHHLPHYDHKLVLQWADLPDWLQLPENRHILDTLTQCVGLNDNDRLLDRHLASRLGQALIRNEPGWIEAVDSVIVRPNGVVTLKCHFHRPAAWVRFNDFCYLVDDQCVRLPGRYDLQDCEGSSLLIVIGVKAKPPRIGETWQGADLRAGLKLATLISGRSFRSQVDHIIVANYEGRLDRHRPYLELATDRPGSRIWWGRPPDEEFGTEISAKQKLKLLDSLYHQWGRIDLNRAYVDLRTYPDSVAIPVSHRSGA